MNALVVRADRRQHNATTILAGFQKGPATTTDRKACAEDAKHLHGHAQQPQAMSTEWITASHTDSTCMAVLSLAYCIIYYT